MTIDELQKEIDWVESFIENLKRTKHPSDIRNSLLLLEKRKQALIDKINSHNLH